MLAGYDNGDVKMFDLRMNKVGAPQPGVFDSEAGVGEALGGCPGARGFRATTVKLTVWAWNCAQPNVRAYAHSLLPLLLRVAATLLPFLTGRYAWHVARDWLVVPGSRSFCHTARPVVA